MESLFIQEIKNESQPLPLALLVSATLIESVKLNTPKLILKFADQDNDITDTFGVACNVELKVTFGDVSVEDGDSYIDQFIVVSPPKKSGDILLVEALQKDVYELKMYLNQPLFFVDSSPKQIFSKLVPSKKVNIVGVSGRGTFHINNGTTPSQMLAQMAKELAAIVFYCRGEFFVISYDQLKRQAKSLTYEYNNPRAENIISALATPFSNNLIERKIVKDYQLWDENLGVVACGSDARKHSLVNVGQDRLKNLNTMLLPVMTGQCVGTTSIKPAMTLGFLLHRFNNERLINESLPDEQIIMELTHHQQGFKYICQMTTGTVNE